MSHLPFIAAAYALTLIGMVALAVASYRDMRSSERRADEMRRDQ